MKLLTFLSFLFITGFVHSQSTEVKYLSGTDKDHTVDWDFKVSGGRNRGEWQMIPVPSNWEMKGFGTYRYWSDWEGEPAPDSVGNYRHTFDIPGAWQNKVVNIVFEGSMTDTEVWVNGQPAGPRHQGGFYEFGYDITRLLKWEETNLLEVKVRRFSTNRSVNLAERRADFWMFSGLFRRVYLEALPEQHISRMAIDARHDGTFSAEVFLKNIRSSGWQVDVRIETLDGGEVGSSLSAPLQTGQEKLTITTLVNAVKPWSAEWPHLYQVRMTLKNGNQTIHSVTEKFGFRTIEVRRGDGLYVNGQKVRLKGTNRHAFWPETGRTTSKILSIVDVNLIKDMNMNAVRMSHYPPDKHFLEVTDSLGLYVIDELTGWQDAYDTEVGKKLVRELIVRDVNHPSVILWANGNEGGWNTDLDTVFSKWDPQNRTVIHPWDNFGGINTSHYEVYDCCTGSFFHGDDLFMPTEFLHGLYDGGHGAGLEDWWNLMMDNPLALGGFLWAFADEGIVRDDQDGRIDVAGNAAPDGIVGPYREKEGSFFAIRQIWSPVYLELAELDLFPGTFDGSLMLENRFDHTNLEDVSFSWRLVDLPDAFNHPEPKVVAKGHLNSPGIAPRMRGSLQWDLPYGWQNHDAVYLTVTDPYGREIYTWSWMISPPEAPARPVSGCIEKVRGQREGKSITMEACGVKVSVDTQTGGLLRVERNGLIIPLSQGPVLIGETGKVTTLNHGLLDTGYFVEVHLNGSLKTIRWELMPDGWLKLNYAYDVRGDRMYDVLGVTFRFPVDEVTGVTWLGRGPYRVWKNRTKGVEYNVWHKPYNNTVTGESWEYPEFKGFHSDVYWAKLETKSQPITMVCTAPDTYLQLFTPAEGTDPRTTHVNFPQGDLSILQGIAPIGTKFHAPGAHGPAGAPNQVPRHGRRTEDEIYFYFGN